MKITREDLLTPANALSITGLLLVVIGSVYLRSFLGIVLVTIGRTLDLLDGPVARATHTSRFGAALDASADKLAIAAMLVGAWAYNIAPSWLLLLIFLENAFVAALTLHAEKAGFKPASSIAGKRAVFLQNAAIIFYALGLISTNGAIILAAELMGIVAGLGGVLLGAYAAFEYARLITTKHAAKH